MRLRYPQTLQTIVLESLVISCGGVIRSLFGIRFGSQTLRGLQRRRQSIWTGFGTTHLRLQPADKSFQFGSADLRLRRRILKVEDFSCLRPRIESSPLLGSF